MLPAAPSFSIKYLVPLVSLLTRWEEMEAANTRWGVSDHSDVKQTGVHLGFPPAPAIPSSADRMPAPEASPTVRKGNPCGGLPGLRGKKESEGFRSNPTQ